MASLHEALFSSRLQFHSSSFISTSSSSSSFRCALPVFSNLSSPAAIKSTQFLRRRSRTKLTDFSLSRRGFVCKASEYKFPDPIPEFAEAETEKFRDHMLKKLSKRDLFEDSVDEIVGICTEIFGTFLRSEYGGPGTLLVIPYIDMADTLNESELPGGPQAARAAIKWAQDHVDKDWKEWTGTYSINLNASNYNPSESNYVSEDRSVVVKLLILRYWYVISSVLINNLSHHLFSLVICICVNRFFQCTNEIRKYFRHVRLC